MTGEEIIKWIQENHAEKEPIYVETRPKLFKVTSGFEILRDEDYPCLGLVVIK